MEASRFLKRLITFIPDWGYTWEADESHVENLLISLGLKEEQARPAGTPCTKAVSYTHLTAADDLLCVDLGGRRIIKKKINFLSVSNWKRINR